MADSVLLKLVRNSMLEVLQAEKIIDKEKLTQAHPILETPLNCKVAVLLQERQKSSYTTQTNSSLLENIIIAAKKAAFEDPTSSPLTTSEFLHAQMELTIYTQEGSICERDEPILQEDAPIPIDT